MACKGSLKPRSAEKGRSIQGFPRYLRKTSALAEMSHSSSSSLYPEGGYTAREAFEILAAQLILANQRTRDAPPSRVQTAESHRIKITENKLQEIRTGRFGRVQLPSEEEARYWLQQWREGAKPKQETPIRKIVIGKNRNEVRE
jgi:hypothetical protein